MRSLLMSVLLIGTLYTSAQVAIPAFGKIEKSELTMSECPFEKSAGAMVLFNQGESYFKIDLNALLSPIFRQTTYHKRIKIFNKNGFDEANIKIKYRSDNKQISIKNLTAQTYNLDASGNIVVTKLDKATLYDKKINSRYSEKIFAFADVKEGSVLEYQYTIDGASAGVWYFQESIPVRVSKFILDMPDELRVSVVPHYTLPVNKSSDNHSSANYSSYTMENVPALNDEPFMSNPEDYQQRLEAKITGIDFPGRPFESLTGTWPGIIKSLIEDEDFGVQLKKDIPRTSELDKLLANVKDQYQKMCIIHKYVKENMQWNDYDNIWALDGVKSAWKDKKGTSGEINLILINLLRDAGLNASPLLVSTKDNGVINPSVPGFDQFNKVMAHVEIGDKYYVLDAVEKNTPSYLIPLDVLASEGLLIKKPESFDWGWKTIWDDTHAIDNNVFINAEIDNKGLMQGVATVTASDYARVKLMPDLKKGNDKLKEKLTNVPGMAIDSFVVTNAEADTLPLIQDFKFSLPTNSSGDYKYFSINLFSGLNKNPFIADERVSDVFFGVDQKYRVTALVFVPDGYTIEELPKNIKMIMPDTSIVLNRVCSFEDGMLSVSINIDFKAPLYTPDVYADLKEFYKKLLAAMDEKFVYKKKA